MSTHESPSNMKPTSSPEKSMSFWDHLDELRKRLTWSLIAFVVGCFGAWEVREKLMSFLVKPFFLAWKAQNLPGEATLHFGTPGAAVLAFVKLSMIGGTVLSIPFISYQLWAFIAPGLYSKEKKYIIPFSGLSLILFLGGIAFAWYAVFPITFNYFLSMSGPVGMVTIVPTVMMGEYIDFATGLFLSFGVMFEIPLVILLLSMAGIVNYIKLIRFGRYYVFFAFIAAAIFTPPEVVQQLIMALPMCILYFLSIGLAYVFGKPPSEYELREYRERKKKK